MSSARSPVRSARGEDGDDDDEGRDDDGAYRRRRLVEYPVLQSIDLWQGRTLPVLCLTRKDLRSL